MASPTSIPTKRNKSNMFYIKFDDDDDDDDDDVDDDDGDDDDVI